MAYDAPEDEAGLKRPLAEGRQLPRRQDTNLLQIDMEPKNANTAVIFTEISLWGICRPCEAAEKMLRSVELVDKEIAARQGAIFQYRVTTGNF